MDTWSSGSFGSCRDSRVTELAGESPESDCRRFRDRSGFHIWQTKGNRAEVLQHEEFVATFAIGAAHQT